MTALVIDNIAFDPEATASMGIAFERACRSLGNGKQPPPVKKIIAKRILEAARQGERDPDRLCERALIAFGIRVVD